jgi:serine/threonine protein kinase
MKFLSDAAMKRLQDFSDAPDLAGTRYTLLERVAGGGMGVVYAARDQKLNRRVALKVLHDADRNGDLERRLIREAQVLSRLEHPGIVPVHDVGRLHDGRVFYTMKFIEGPRLDSHIASVDSVPDRLRLFLRICDAVAFAHARGVLHRDLKPANVMVGPFGEVLVLDWGLAKILPEPYQREVSLADPEDKLLTESTRASDVKDTARFAPTTAHGTVMGTPGYMSPEQARGENNEVGARSDIFSLGALLRFVVTRQAAEADSSSHVAIDKTLDAICQKAMAANPGDRYVGVSSLASDVSRYLDGLPVSARKETFAERALRFYRRYNVAILLITAYLLMRVILLLVTHR